MDRKKLLELDEQGFIAHINKNRDEVTRLLEEADRLKYNNERDIEAYALAHAKFKEGDMVRYKKENYRTPRKYIIRQMSFAIIARDNDGSSSLVIHYSISTENGHKPNGGWSVEEKDLEHYNAN